MDNSDGFSQDAVLEALRDTRLHAFIELVLELDSVIASMTIWCEQCPCHQDVFARHRHTHIPLDVVRYECGAAATACTCPNRGCRAPELAAGEVMRVLEQSFNRALGRLTLAWRSRLPD
eukprot:5870151-Alexandrium_andersonii.AAC.1